MHGARSALVGNKPNRHFTTELWDCRRHQDSLYQQISSLMDVKLGNVLPIREPILKHQVWA
jgi:hypothetical protein